MTGASALPSPRSSSHSAWPRLWLGYDCEWTMLRWVAAFFADIAVLGLVGRALATPPRMRRHG